MNAPDSQALASHHDDSVGADNTLRPLREGGGGSRWASGRRAGEALPESDGVGQAAEQQSAGDGVDEVPVEAQRDQHAEVAVSRRYERGSIILTSNKAFSEWGQVFTDEVLAPPSSTGCCTNLFNPRRGSGLQP